MTKKTRLLILLFCVICFFVAAPIIVAYSMGYRFDFEKMKIVATGGIYVRTFPVAEEITIDSKILLKPRMFSNSIFVQSLLPKNHTVSIKKSGYYDYFKTLPVSENEVTKLENVLLFKKEVIFEILQDQTQSPFLTRSQRKFTIKNNNLYYSDILENVGITADQKAVPIIKNLVAFEIWNANIIWLGTDGFLYQSDSAGKNSQKLNLTALKINKKGVYKIIAAGQNILLYNGAELLLLDKKTSDFEVFSESAKDAIVSPDAKNLIYFDDNNIYISPIAGLNIKIPLYKSEGKVNECLWLNNDYIIFNEGDKITISEIDFRGNINKISLPQAIGLTDGTMLQIKSPQIFFDRQSGKLYILTGDALLLSEKLTP